VFLTDETSSGNWKFIWRADYIVTWTQNLSHNPKMFQVKNFLYQRQFFGWNYFSVKVSFLRWHCFVLTCKTCCWRANSGMKGEGTSPVANCWTWNYWNKKKPFKTSWKWNVCSIPTQLTSTKLEKFTLWGSLWFIQNSKKACFEKIK